MANIYDMVDAWNDAGTVFTAIKMNVTDTASDADSLLMNLQVGGSSKFSVAKNGNIVTPANIQVGNTNSFYFGSRVELNATSDNFLQIKPRFNSNSVYIGPDGVANILAQRNGANPQTFNIYNTYTDASNYERGFMKWDTNVLKIGTEASGTGTDRGISIVQGSNVIVSMAPSQITPFAKIAPGNSTTDLGKTTSPFRDIYLRPSASLTPSANGDLCIEATNDTTLTFKLKGSDGTVRSGTVTLA